MKIVKFAAAIGLAAIAFQANATNLVTNGSFEQVANGGTQGAGSWSVYSSIPGWTGQPNIEVRDSIAGVAQDGSNFVELDTDYVKNTNSSMFQNIAGTGAVKLSFWYSARPNTAAGTNLLSFALGNSTGSVLNNTGNNTGSHSWQQYVGYFNLDADGLTTLSFSAGGKQDSYGGSLDNVVVTAVPEPETYALMLAGLGLVGAIARRRNQRKTS
jgi:hypothetical protein